MTTLAEALKGGGRYIRWDDLGRGTTVTGTVIDVQIRQARKFESTDLDFWDDGTPKMQAVITLATNFRDGADPEDDGTRNVTVNLWSGQKQALAAACRNAGIAEPTPGDTFTATWTSGVGKAKDPRVFVYAVTPGSGLGGQLADAQPDPQMAAQTVPAYTPAPAPNPAPVAAQAAPQPASKPDQAKALWQAGVPLQQIADATGYTPEVVAALINTF